MAARTLTYTLNMAASAKGAHIGTNVVTFDFNSGATKLGTVSDVVLLGKIPSGAVLTDFAVDFGTQGSAASTWTLLLLSDEGSGTYSILKTFARSGPGSMTANATTSQSYLIPTAYKVSYSDDRAVRYATVALNCTVGPSETASYSFQGFFRFVTDGRSA